MVRNLPFREHSIYLLF